MDTAEDEGRRSADPDDPLSLVYVGSAENDFEHAGRVFALPPSSRVRFGRGEAFAVAAEAGGLTASVPLPWASGAHCELQARATPEGPRLWLRDLGSRNGTLLEGRRVEGEVPLALGRVFEVGRSFWTVRVQRTGGLSETSALFAVVAPPLRHVGSVLERVARSELPVLVIGETGTGKESIARAIHERSGRAGAFVVVGVSAFGPERMEAELGAGSRFAPGAARRGRGGTMYLADVGQLDGRAQVALLAALERLPAGEQGVRVVAGADRELRRSAGKGGHFRAELYSRLAGFEVRLPTLRESPEDIGLMVRQLGHMGDRARLRLSTPALRHLLGHSWPFNREQLLACLTTASMLPSTDGFIGEDVVRDALLGAHRSNLSLTDSEPPSGPLHH